LAGHAYGASDPIANVRDGLLASHVRTFVHFDKSQTPKRERQRHGHLGEKVTGPATVKSLKKHKP
jgi:hypothetical protein